MTISALTERASSSVNMNLEPSRFRRRAPFARRIKPPRSTHRRAKRPATSAGSKAYSGTSIECDACVRSTHKLSGKSVPQSRYGMSKSSANARNWRQCSIVRNRYSAGCLKWVFPRTCRRNCDASRCRCSSTFSASWDRSRGREIHSDRPEWSLPWFVDVVPAPMRRRSINVTLKLPTQAATAAMALPLIPPPRTTNSSFMARIVTVASRSSILGRRIGRGRVFYLRQ